MPFVTVVDSRSTSVLSHSCIYFLGSKDMHVYFTRIDWYTRCQQWPLWMHVIFSDVNNDLYKCRWFFQKCSLAMLLRLISCAVILVSRGQTLFRTGRYWLLLCLKSSKSYFYGDIYAVNHGAMSGIEVVPLYLVRSVREFDILISSENFWWITDEYKTLYRSVYVIVIVDFP